MENFNIKMLTLARESRGYTQKELANNMNVSQGTISKIENEQLDASLYADKFCEVLDYPLSFFRREGEDAKLFESNIHYYRKKGKAVGGDLLQINAILNIIKLNIERLLKHIDIPKYNLPFWDIDNFGTPTLFAKYLREYWRIPKGRISNLTQIVEANGIIVVHIYSENDKFDGLSITTISNQPIIFLNNRFPGDRVRLTLAHELGHFAMHFAKKVDKSREVEEEAYEFASEFLAPSHEVSNQLVRVNLEKLADLKRYWKISMRAFLEKAKKLNVITDNTYRFMITQFRKNNYHVNEPNELNVPLEKPTLINEIIDTFINDLGYSEEQLAKALSLNLEDFHNYYLPSNAKFKVIRKV